mmetsp:Transcript_19890/g.34050  ORF Transcript_19890/g.34050 Transcript_19890/m.34050 type:complete len:298 (-) Transcript_19890:26-919(-)
MSRSVLCQRGISKEFSLMVHPSCLTTRLCDEELQHAICLHALSCNPGPHGHIAKITRFADEALAEVVSISDIGMEAIHTAHTESLAIYGKRLTPLLGHDIDNLILTREPEHVQQACNDIVSLISDGLPIEDEPIEFGPMESKCTEEEGIACLVQCGGDSDTPLRRPFVGFLLCLFAEMWSFSESNLALVVDHGGLPLITAALSTDSTTCSFQKTALTFLEKAVDLRNCYDVRVDIARYAACSTGLIPSLLEAVRVEQDKAVAVLSGLVHADRNLLMHIADRTIHELINRGLDPIGAS